MPDPTTTSAWATYQPIIIGLGAVVLGTIGNTLLEWFKLSQTKKHEADALRRALAEELRVYQQSAAGNAVRANDTDESGSMVIPIAEAYPIYEASRARLGLLTPKEVSAVVASYAALQAFRETMPVIGKLQRVEGAVLLAVVGARWGDVLASSAKHMSETMLDAIARLESRGRRGAPMEHPRSDSPAESRS